MQALTLINYTLNQAEQLSVYVFQRKLVNLLVSMLQMNLLIFHLNQCINLLTWKMRIKIR